MPESKDPKDGVTPGLPARTAPGPRDSGPRAGPQTHEGQADRIERFQSLQPGRYWRARKNIRDDDDGKKGKITIPAGTVLLLRRIKRVDDKPHAVELHGHPLSEYTSHTFLVQEFLNNFDFEENGAAVRATEMEAVQAKIGEKQQELIEFQRSPEKLLELVRAAPALPKPTEAELRRRRHNDDEVELPETPFDFAAGLPDGSVRASTSIATMAAGAANADLLGKQLNNQAIIAKKRADWIIGKTNEIAETAKMLTPFYEEQGAAALASAEDALTSYKKLVNGLQSLSLYTGKDVEVTPVRAKGEQAPADTPLVVLQAKLYMNEESLINLHDGGADFSKFGEFIDLLKKDDKLRDRVLPFQRCIIAMQYTREDKDYGYRDKPSMDETLKNLENKKFFLVIRNGERIHTVHSSIEETERLFPTSSDLDQPFKKGFGFSGIESEEITIDDIQYSEAKSAYDNIVLHYRRVLILLAGLYDREREVIGDFVALEGKSGLAMLSQPMQEACFHYISDEENALTDGRVDFYEWLAEKNRATQSGSRILANWYTLMTSRSAPAAVRPGRGSNDRDYFAYEPKNKYEITVVYRDGQDFMVKSAVEGTTWTRGSSGQRAFDAAVNLNLYKKFGSDRGNFGYLCMDAVSLEEINHYIYTRHNRSGYIKYVKLLIEARNAIERDLAHEKPLRAYLVDAIKAGGVAFTGRAADEAVSEIIRQWRAAHRGRPAPIPEDADWTRESKSMLDQLWVLAGHGRDRKKAVEDLCREQGREPLRLTLSGKNKLYLYATPIASERNELLGPHHWVARLTIEELKTKISVSDVRQVTMPEISPAESPLAEWDGADAWIERHKAAAHKLDYHQIASVQSMVEVARQRIADWLTPKSEEEFSSALARLRTDTNERSNRSVSHASVFVPLALSRTTHIERKWRGFEDGDKETTTVRYFVSGFLFYPMDALYAIGNDEQKAAVEKWINSIYRTPDHALKSLRKGFSATYQYVGINRFMDATGTELLSGGLFDGERFPSGSDRTDFSAWLKPMIKDIEKDNKKSMTEFVIRCDEEAQQVLDFMEQARNAPTGGRKKAIKP